MAERPSVPRDGVDVVLGGTIFCDLVFSGSRLPAPGTEVFADGFTLAPGGTANRAVACARLGARTALLGVLGADVLGGRVADLLAAEPGLDLTRVRRLDGVTTAVTVAVTDGQERSFITYEEAATALPDTLPGPLPAARLTHTGIVHGVPDWARRLRAAGTTVFGGVGWDATGAWSAAVLDHLRDVDVLVLNEVEACSYTRTADAEAAAGALARRVGTVVVTRGADGALAVDAGTGTRVCLPAVPVAAVDPTGAGDVFTAALMRGFLLDWDLATRVRLALLAAALSVRTRGGASAAPRRADLAAFLATARPDGDYAAVEDWARGGT